MSAICYTQCVVITTFVLTQKNLTRNRRKHKFQTRHSPNINKHHKLNHIFVQKQYIENYINEGIKKNS